MRSNKNKSFIEDEYYREGIYDRWWRW